MKDEKETAVEPERKDPLEELAGEIGRVIADNRKFLARFLEEDFEPDDEPGEEDEEPPEEL